MSTLRISDAPLLPDVDGTEKIPTGGRGDYAISVDQIKDHIFQGVGKELVGLGNVDNTSDLDKPVSTAQQVALDLKADKTYVDTNLELKADKTNVYTRTETSLAFSKKADLVNGVVPEDQIPSSFNDVLEFTTSNLPIVGESGKIYITTDTNRTWRWSGNQYVEVSNGGISDSTIKLHTPKKIANVDFDGTQNIDIPHNNLINRDIIGAHLASAIKDSSGCSQQEINNSAIQLIQNIESLRSYKGNKNKQQVGTLEYHTGSGYGGALYQWDAGSTDNDDGMFTFAVTGVATGRWKLVIENNALNASKVGVKGGLISSLVASDYTDHIKMQALIDYFSSIGGGTIYVNGGKTYQWNVQHKSKVKIIGLGLDGLKPTIRCRDVSNTHLFTMAQPECYLENFNLNGYDSREILQTGGSGNIGAFSGVACQSTNLILKSITATRCRMDGVYMNSGANDVHVYNLDSRFHARNSVSITNAWNVHFYNPIVEQRAAIQPFAYNFDIEPDTGSTQTVYDIHIHNPVMLGEGTLLLKEENTPNGRMDVHIYYPQMDIPIRLNSVVHGLYIYGGKFTKGLFVAETGRPGAAVDGFIDGAVISGSPFVQTTVTIGGDFVLRNNTINELAEGSPSRTQGTWENNTFGAGVTPVANADRRTLTLPYREKALLEVVSPTGALSAYSTTEVRQVNLTTTPTPILTAKNRSTSIITIAAADASAGGSVGLVELVISSDDTASVTFATDKINGVSGITYSWNGRTLSLATKDAPANQWVVKVETFATGANYKQVTWLV